MYRPRTPSEHSFSQMSSASAAHQQGQLTPLVNNNPLLQRHWNQLDQQHRTWPLEKYTRLQDTRNQPLVLNRALAGRLVIQFKDEVNKAICVYHNYQELEAFCVHPLLFAHDLVSKDTKLLFCVKDQIDASVRYKFRVTFASNEGLNAFCSTVAGFMTIKTYEEWGGRHNNSLNLSFCSNQSTVSSSSNLNLLNLSQQSDNNNNDNVSMLAAATSTIGSGRTIGGGGGRISSPMARIRARSAENLLGRRQSDGIGLLDAIIIEPTHVNASTQTSPQKTASSSGAENPNGTAPTNGQPPIINVNVNLDNLISMEAIREFGRVLSNCIGTGNQQQNGNNRNMGIQQQSTTSAKKQTGKRGGGHAANQTNNNNKRAKVKVEPLNAGVGAKKKDPRRSLWALYDIECRVKELLKSKKKIPEPRRLGTGYYLRGSCPPVDDESDVDTAVELEQMPSTSQGHKSKD